MERRHTIGAISLVFGIAGLTTIISNTNSSQPSQTQSREIVNTTPVNHKKEWSKAYSVQGTELNGANLFDIPIFNRKAQTLALQPRDAARVEQQLLSESMAAKSRFDANPLPKHFDDGTLFFAYITAAQHQELLNPFECARQLDVANNPAYIALKRDDHPNPTTILNTALGITFETFQPQPVLPSNSLDDLLMHARIGHGGQADYTYLAANLYFAMCEQLGHLEYIPKLDIVSGITLGDNGELLAWRTWLRLDQGVPKDIGTQEADLITDAFDGHNVIRDLNTYDTTVGLLSQRIDLNDGGRIIRTYAHVMPEHR